MRLRRGITNLVLAASMVAVPAVGFTQRQEIYDWWVLRDYIPPPAIANLATADTMNEKARRIFYVNEPELIADTTNFRNNCSTGEQTIVLGCYHSGQQGIFVFDVTDERLLGIEEVTAAHEMLHAAYDRLSAKDKEEINRLLTDYYQNELKDKRILDTIEGYKKTEPYDVVNEMHSIFGTEVTSLPAPLEEYYKRYFNNRAAVVAYSQKYEAEFTSRTNKAQQYEEQLNSLQQKIDAAEAALAAQSERITSEQARLDALRSSGQLEEYNRNVAGYNVLVDAYNSGVASYKRDVERYNNILAQYNSVAGELNQLYGAIDTRLSPKTK